MKIALTSLYLPSGSKIGAGYQAHHLANALTGRGHRVTVFSPCGLPSDGKYELQVVAERKPMSSFRFPWDLRKFDFSGFDILHGYGDDWMLWGKKRPRHVHTYAGSCLAEMLHAPSWVGKLRMAALALLEQQSVLLVDESIAISENTRKYIKGIGHVIPCGVNVSAFRPSGEKSVEPSILFVGTIHGRKRGRMLLDLFRREIRPKVKDAELWCVCDRPEGESDVVGVKFMGRIDEEALTELYRRAWVFCLPSTYEGFGVPYIEAMASGTAVVATKNVGALEVTGNGKWGVVCNDDQLATEIKRVLEDAKHRAFFEQAGLQRSLDFSWDMVCARYEELYQSGSTKGVAAAAV